MPGLEGVDFLLVGQVVGSVEIATAATAYLVYLVMGIIRVEWDHPLETEYALGVGIVLDENST